MDAVNALMIQWFDDVARDKTADDQHTAGVG